VWTGTLLLPLGNRKVPFLFGKDKPPILKTLAYHKRGRDVSDRLPDQHQNLDDCVAIPGENEDNLRHLKIKERLVSGVEGSSAAEGDCPKLIPVGNDAHLKA
jgi:hypothetical protein